MALLTEAQLRNAARIELEETRAALTRQLARRFEEDVIAAVREALIKVGVRRVATIVCMPADLGVACFFRHVVSVKDVDGQELHVSSAVAEALEDALDGPLEALVYNGWPVGRIDELTVDVVAETLSVAGRDEREPLVVHLSDRWWIAKHEPMSRQELRLRRRGDLASCPESLGVERR